MKKNGETKVSLGLFKKEKDGLSLREKVGRYLREICEEILVPIGFILFVIVVAAYIVRSY